MADKASSMEEGGAAAVQWRDSEVRWHRSGGTAAASRLDITISKGVPLASNRQDCTDYLLSACTAHPLLQQPT